ncbi:MAG: DUF4175 family protein [Balneolaceae bacterium]|nr:DUF4175 family protein [Balneolaceae bacterium]
MNAKKKDEYEINSLSDLIHIIRKSYRKVTRRKKISAITAVISVFAFGIILLVLLEDQFYLSSVLKSLGLLFSLITAFILGWKIRSNFDQSNFRSFYNAFADWGNFEAVRNAIDLESYQREDNLGLRKAAIDQNIASLSDQHIHDQLDNFSRQNKDYTVFRSSLIGFCVAVFITSFLYFQKPDAVNRSLHFWKSYQAPNPYSFSIDPGDIVLEQGSPFSPTITFEGPMPDNLNLAFKTNIEKSYRSRPAHTVDSSTASFSALTPTTSGTYYFEMDGFESKKYKVNVQLLPRFKTLSVNVDPPAYTNLESTTYQYPFSNIKAYKGSDISITGTANKDLSSLNLIKSVKNDTLDISTKDGRNFSYNFELFSNDTLSFSMQDSVGLNNKNRFEFVITPQEDEAPFVQIVQPESNLEMQTPEDLPVEFEASDDFGLTSAVLKYELKKAFRESPETGSKKLQVPSLNSTGNFIWKISELNANPRDVLSYWIEVTDNDAINGSKKARSRTLTVTFPSLTSYIDELQDSENNVEKDLQDVSNSFEQMKREYDRFKEQLKENPQGNWEQQQTLDEVKKKQQEIDKKVEDLNKKFEEIRQEMQNSDLMSKETMDTYNELQKLIKEIDDPELQKALEKLQESMGSLNQQQLREALENFEFNEQQYQERIKRTLELFKSLKLNSDLDKLAKALEDLAKQEGEIAESQEAGDEQIKKQEAVQQDVEKLSEELDKLSENAPEDAKEKVKELQEEARKQIDDTEKEIEENLEKLQESDDAANSRDAKQQQQRIQQQLQQMAQNVRSKQQQLSQQQQQINITALQYILYSLITLSEKQEDLTQDTQSLSNRSQGFVDKARIEQSIKKQFSQLSDSLFQISTKLPSFSNRINQRKNQVDTQLASAVEQLSERDKSKSTFAQRQSLGGINELASMIASLINQIQSQPPGGGGPGQMSMQQMIEQIQKMSGQQQLLNQQMQDLINDIQGERLSQDQMQRLNQMSRQQNQIRKQLKELQNSGQLESGDRVLSELERMSEQMEETINDLRGGQTDELIIERQQNILSRMLNAEKALQERGKEEKREGTTATDRPRATPPDVTLEELQKKIRDFLNDPKQTKFTEDYQNLIRQYFELLRKQQQKDEGNGSF